MILDSFTKYQGLMADFAKKYIMPMKDASDQGEEFLPERFEEFYKIFNGFNEILETLETIEMLQSMMKLNPPRGKTISVDLYYKHIISSYISEIYILKERLNAYAKVIARTYFKDGDLNCRLDDLDHLHTKIKESTKSINDTRNNHVHMQRHSDTDLNFLSTLRLVSDQDYCYRDSLKVQTKFVRRNWAEQFSNNNKAMDLLLVDYFEDIFRVICVKDEVLLPINSSKKA